MHSFIDEGLVLRRYNYADSDRMFVVFTKEHGKMSASAKGVRRLTSHKAPHLELFIHNRLYFVTGHLPLITQAQTLHGFSNLRHNLLLARSGFHLLEVLDKLLPEDQPLPELFQGAIDTLSSLDELDSSLIDHRHLYLSRFYQHLLSFLGFGLPPKLTPSSLYSYLETVLDQKIISAKSFL